MGRPKMPKGEARTERVVAHLRKADFEKLRSRAEVRGVEVGQLVREILERALARRKK